MNADDKYCEDLVRRFDEDRYLASIFAPASARPHLFAIYAWNFEVAKTAEIVSQPVAGQMRLQFWRDAIKEIYSGSVRDHPVARALAEAIRGHQLPRPLFDELIDAREADLEPAPFADMDALEAYADATSGNVMRLAADVLSGDATPDDVARHAGVAYALIGLVRSRSFHEVRGHAVLPPGVSEGQVAQHALDLMKNMPRVARGYLPAFLPAALVRTYARALSTEVPRFQKQRAMAWAMLRGRL